MKVHLLSRDGDLDLERKPPPLRDALVNDLGLQTLYAAMAEGDDYLLDVASKTIAVPLLSVDGVTYRQDVLKDCLASETTIRQVYDLCVEAIDAERKNYMGSLTRYPTSLLYRSIQVLEMLSGKLKILRDLLAERRSEFRSEGLQTLAGMVARELDDDYLAEVARHLKALRFRRGITMSATLGPGNAGRNYVLRTTTDADGWFSRLLHGGPEVYTYHLPERDESGARALSDLRERGVNLVADALTRSTDHVTSFFKALRAEIGFYVGCLNLHQTLGARHAPICFPMVTPPDERRHTALRLIDVVLRLNSQRDVVANDLEADRRSLTVITGANQGGKSTFLRSVGLSQVMAQAGMFVAADRLDTSLVANVLTHFKREEDTTMRSGKFDEELVRMDAIVEQLDANSMVLFNESFSSTNEREGSEVARQIVDALLELPARMVFVTHQYELAHELATRGDERILCLRAARSDDGTRSFRIEPGEPLRTSFGDDLYRRIFGNGIEDDAGLAPPPPPDDHAGALHP